MKQAKVRREFGKEWHDVVIALARSGVTSSEVLSRISSAFGICSRPLLQTMIEMVPISTAMTEKAIMDGMNRVHEIQEEAVRRVSQRRLPFPYRPINLPKVISIW